MMQARETHTTRIRRYQWLEVLLPTVLSFPFITVYFATPLSLAQVGGSYALLLLPLQLFLAGYQYRVSDEYSRLNLLKAHAVAGLTLSSGLLLLLALSLLGRLEINWLSLFWLSAAWSLAFSATFNTLNSSKGAYE
ncbi:hypothetical protein [Deinococcus rubellus]|uniref:Uncharacterized protein n=1 Tax=Deinococcus rubellus TaxID=1889240 RepID=A0ABY5YEK9_9DEIO|nr:hypothetical protein [Deinococcus rubellus]UWX63280.1 hypothetical protein N0D28_11035 [Deinococcus rubellus]